MRFWSDDLSTTAVEWYFTKSIEVVPENLFASQNWDIVHPDSPCIGEQASPRKFRDGSIPDGVIPSGQWQGDPDAWANGVPIADGLESPVECPGDLVACSCADARDESGIPPPPTMGPPTVCDPETGTFTNTMVFGDSGGPWNIGTTTIGWDISSTVGQARHAIVEQLSGPNEVAARDTLLCSPSPPVVLSGTGPDCIEVPSTATGFGFQSAGSAEVKVISFGAGVCP